MISVIIKAMYDFNLPKKLIAQKPAEPRDHARLLVYRLQDTSISNHYFYELNNFLPADTTVVVNNSRVENCRWLFDGAQTEIFVLQKLDPFTVRALVRPGKKFKLGSSVHLTTWLRAEVTDVDKDGIRTLQLSVPHDDKRLIEYEHVPLPPYIHQDDQLENDYQTVYAVPTGSKAAPTAGLHFTPELLSKIKKYHDFAEVTLHVGLGTFAKLTDENMAEGRLHSEQYFIDTSTAEVLNAASHITAVGTTTIRTLESARTLNDMFRAGQFDTDIFIKPGYRFLATDALITNFHLPSTSLLMMIAAFIADKQGLGEKAAADELMRIYKHAVDESYRFYSFGDAMIIV